MKEESNETFTELAPKYFCFYPDSIQRNNTLSLKSYCSTSLEVKQ